MPLALLAFVRGIPWWVYAVIAAALVVLGYGHTRYKAGEHSRDKEVAGLHQTIATDAASIVTLKRSIADQNAGIEALAKQGADAQDAANRATARAAKFKTEAAGLQAKLRARGRAVTPHPCAVDPINADAWETLK